MDILSPYIIAGALGWIVSQTTKYVIAGIKSGKMGSIRQLYLSGHMPSAHSATVIAVVTVIGLKDGFGSGLFGLAAVFASVVLYDAMMVRRSSGEQGVALKELLIEQKSKVAKPRVAMGHTPLEVFVGSIVGVVIGVGVYFVSLV